jgi:hypothetical protein
MFSLKFKSISNFVFCRRPCWLPNSLMTPVLPTGYIQRSLGNGRVSRVIGRGSRFGSRGRGSKVEVEGQKSRSRVSTSRVKSRGSKVENTNFLSILKVLQPLNAAKSFAVKTEKFRLWLWLCTV